MLFAKRKLPDADSCHGVCNLKIESRKEHVLHKKESGNMTCKILDLKQIAGLWINLHRITK